MPIVERELAGWQLTASTPKQVSSITSFSLESSPDAIFRGYTWTLDFPLANAYRTILTGKDRVRPPHDNVILRSKPVEFKLTSLDAKACRATFDFPSAGPSHLDGAGKTRVLKLDWASSLTLSSWETDVNGKEVRILHDLPNRSYGLTEHGVCRRWYIPHNNLHLGAGERAGPIDLTQRAFQMHGQDSAHYDAFEGDPLYKHTPFVISTPRPTADGEVPVSTYAIFHATNSFGIWDIGKQHDDPSGYFKSYTQDFGGLEEWVLVGKGVQEVSRTWGEIVGMPKLVGRDWLGYLASGMGLGESVSPSLITSSTPAHCAGPPNRAEAARGLAGVVQEV